jgi:hypothetical protein
MFDLRMRGVGELAELPVTRKATCSPMSTALSPIRSIWRHHIHPDPPLQHPLVVRHRKLLLQHAEVAGELKLAPDLPRVRWGVHAAEDTHAKRVGRRRDRRSGRGHLRGLRDESRLGQHPNLVGVPVESR